MYGHGAPQPPRSAATVITLRVLIALAGFLSCGLLSCVPLFRVALLRGRTLDWAVAWVSIPLSIALLMVVGSLPEADVRTDMAVALMLLLGIGAAAYYLVVDIRHHSRPHPYPGPLGHGTAPYGYPQPTPPSPYATTAVSSPPVPQHPVPPQQVPPVPPHQTPHPGPAAPLPPTTPPPAPQRIDQVRAELDELSDYLRRHDGPEGHHGPGGIHGNGR
ncbi:hypothetical protein [Streptomyces sp. bgisy022]|uniref:hypothetical protein n=1 Tax=Streptomyces sp. bgisy022 TaxID=3413769 RepID=UPI003D70B9E7